MMPTAEQLRAIANEIARQFPSLVDDGPGAGGDRVLRLTTAQIAAVSHALGLATAALLEARTPSPAARGWAAIIDAALMARGAPGIDGAALGALARVDPETLERMAALVLGPPGPAGGEARAVLDEADVMRADEAERELARAREAVDELDTRVEDLESEANGATAAVRALEVELDALVEWASPLSRDMGAVGGLRTIRRTMEDERAALAKTESLVERLDEALCTLLHDGGEPGEHSPETHLELFLARPEPVRDAERAVLAACRAALIVTTAPDDFLAPASEHEIRKAIEAWRLAERDARFERDDADELAELARAERYPGMLGPDDMLGPERLAERDARFERAVADELAELRRAEPEPLARVIGVDPMGRDTRLDGLTDEQIRERLGALDDED